jgi:O-6-methylguanine DNA methyltransferase
MLAIPWGSALTYGELAVAVGSPRATRAVGTACATNRLPLIIPCHRVLAADGPGGFSSGLEWKAKLLELETEPQP